MHHENMKTKLSLLTPFDEIQDRMLDCECEGKPTQRSTYVKKMSITSGVMLNMFLPVQGVH